MDAADESLGRGKTVLVVDDAAAVRRALMTELEHMGFQTVGAADGLSGLEQIEHALPDLVLCDIRMPRMDGLQLLAAVRASHPEVPVVMMSGAGLLDDAVGALKLGAWDYIQKPILAGAAFVHPIRRALERAALLEENRRYRVHLESLNRELQTTLRLLAEDEEAGRQLQARMLPRNHQWFGPFEFSRELIPSAFLSGDFIDAFTIDERRWGFYLADVSGHGVSSALVTVLLRTFVSRHVADFVRGGDELILSPAALLQRLNEEMSLDELDKHLTIFLGVMDVRDCALVYANAGQFPWPLLHDGKQTLQLAEPAVPLGLWKKARYHEHRLAFPETGVLAAFSDGLLEVLPHPNMAAKQSFLEALFGRTSVTLEQVRREIDLDARMPLPDDVALLLIKRGGHHG